MGPADFDLASVDLVLRTTRSVQRKLDYSRPVAPELIEECIEIATQAPTGRNAQAWRFLVVTEPEAKRWLGELYRRAFEHYAALREADPAAEPVKAMLSWPVRCSNRSPTLPQIKLSTPAGSTPASVTSLTIRSDTRIASSKL